MFPNALSRVGVLLVVVLVAACGDDDGGGRADASVDGGAGDGGELDSGLDAGADGGDRDAGPAPGSIRDDYCAPLAMLICERADACGCSAELDVAACTATWTDRCLEAYAGLQSAVSMGRMAILAERARACIARIAETTPECERPSGLFALGLCDPWFTSNADFGDPCEEPVCGGGAGTCVGGTCQIARREGDPCNFAGCASGLVCLGDVCVAPAGEGSTCDEGHPCDPALRCVGGSCVAPAAASGACTTTEACEQTLVCEAMSCAEPPPGPCTGEPDCGARTTCVVPRVCAASGAVGSACDRDEGCASGLYCDDTSSQCTALPGDGEACVRGTYCAEGLGCTTDGGTCAPAPGAGEACLFGPMGPSVCASGLACVAGACATPPGDGEPCAEGYVCAEGLGCDFRAEGSFCVALGTEGAACNTSRTCAPGFHCDGTSMTCTADFAAGTPCSAGDECGAEGVCAPSASGGFACAPRPAIGEACFLECATGAWCAPDAASARCVPDVCREL